MSVKIADFGECKMFINEQDEYCTRNRGTEYIKSPEMLNLGYNIRRDDDKFDRRKKIGTSRTSDIWSIGCLFYELLTGKYLFEDELTNEYFVFINKLNSSSIFELLTSDKIKELNNNVYIIDFLKFILVKDPQSRPNIKTILSRYDHVHALLVSLGNPYSSKYMNSLSKRVNVNIEICFELCINMMGNNKDDDFSNNLDDYNLSKQVNYNLQFIPNLMKITEDIYVCDVNGFSLVKSNKKYYADCAF
jgi:serine/threonine protein kinase